MSNDINVDDPTAIAEEVAKELDSQEVEMPETPKEETPAETKEAVIPEVKEEVREVPKEETQEQPTERTPRTSQYVPVSKANAWRHEANEAKARAAELEKELQSAREEVSKKSSDDELSEIAKKISEERNVDADAVKDILRAAKTPADIPELKTVLELKKQLEQQTEQSMYREELNQTLTKFPELKGHETDLKELAYAEGNEKVPLELLAYKLRDELNLADAPPSAEGKAPQIATETEMDYENMTEEQLNALTGDQLDKFIDWQSKGVLKRTGIRL